MDPGRKRGAKGVSELNLGDLVLAKVKGFPAWPAKIRRPEDWNKAPNPKKYFVEFLGTGEIAFVAPVDIQAFTIKTKNKLAARCQGKTVKYFAQAVTEICEEFDLLQCKNISSIRNDNIAQNLESKAHSVDPAADEASEVSAEDGIDSEGPNHRLEINGLSKQGSEFGHSQNRQEIELQDVMPCSSDGNKHGSPAYVSPVKICKLSENPSRASVKKEGSHNVKAELGCSDGGQRELTNGDRSKPAVWPKRKHGNTVCRKSSLVIPPEHKGDEKQNKYASGSKMKVSSEAKGVKTKSELNLGDLVLAKVKGFPSWPAKIRRPEDWNRAPHPKKYFVQFLGTREIAFVAPVDIQAFTIETKNKLAARCQGKTVKYFAQAVTEICEEFDLLQCKNISSIRNGNIAQNLESKAHSVDPVVDEASEVSAEDGIDSEGPNHRLEINGLSKQGSEFGHSQNRQEIELQDVMPCSSDGNKHGSPAYVSPVKICKLSENPSRASVKKEGSHNVKAELGCSDGGQRELTNGDRSKPAVWPKRKHENTVCRKSSLVIPPEHKGDEKQNKCASRSKMKVSSADSSRLGSGLGSERKEKKLLKEKNICMALSGRENAEVTEDHSEVVSRKKAKFQHDHGKLISRTMEASYPAKKSKTADVLDGAKLQRAQAIKKNPISHVDLDDRKDGTESKR